MKVTCAYSNYSGLHVPNHDLLSSQDMIASNPDDHGEPLRIIEVPQLERSVLRKPYNVTRTTRPVKMNMIYLTIVNTVPYHLNMYNSLETSGS